MEEEGSLTLEAAFVLPLFLFACFCLVMPMRMLDRHRRIQAAAEAVSEELSQYAYLEYCMQEGGGAVDAERAADVTAPETGGAGSVSESLGAAYAAAAVLGRIETDWIEQPSFAGTAVGPDDMVHIELHYRMRLPFRVLGLGSVPMEHVSRRRMWTGAEGGRGANAQAGEEAQEMVYVGRDSSRYHRSRTCHYIYNELQPVVAGKIAEQRNRDGKRYQPCDRCGGSTGATVYVMPYGTSYHASGSCSAIISYVQMVPLEQVKGLGECSYCGGG